MNSTHFQNEVEVPKTTSKNFLVKIGSMSVLIFPNIVPINHEVRILNWEPERKWLNVGRTVIGLVAITTSFNKVWSQALRRF